MMTILRWISISVVIMVVVFGASSWLEGYYFKKAYFSLIESINADTKYKIDIVSYQQGLLTSHAKLTIQSGRRPLQSNVEQTITHGPFVYDAIQNKWVWVFARIDSHVRIEPLQKWLGLTEEQTLLNAQTLAGYDGTYTTQLQVPALTTQVIPYGKFSSSGFSGELNLRSVQQHMDWVRTNGKINVMQVENNATTFTMQDFQSHSDMSYNPLMALWSGSYQSSIGVFSGHYGQNNRFSIKNLKGLTTFGIDHNTTYNILFDLSLDQLLISDQIVLQPSSIKLSIYHLNANAMTNLKKADVSTVAARQAAVMNLITPSTSIGGDIRINTSNGHILLTDMMIQWPAQITATVPHEVFRQANFQAVFRISIPLANILAVAADQHAALLPGGSTVAQTPVTMTTAPVVVPVSSAPAPRVSLQQQMSEWLRQGYLVENKGDYVARVTFSSDILKINDKEYPAEPAPPVIRQPN